jgi:hypothetical protein
LLTARAAKFTTQAFAITLNPAVILSSRADLADTKAAGGG